MITDKMNPLLRKLAKEPFQLSVDHAAELDMNYMELFTVLFAEAIVQEFVDIGTEQCSSFANEDLKRGGMHVIECIKEHFGKSNVLKNISE